LRSKPNALTRERPPLQPTNAGMGSGPGVGLDEPNSCSTIFTRN